MSDIASWLRSLGLGKYEGVFAANEIDFEVLPKLTEAHLEKLGIPMGPRIQLLEAIAALSDEDIDTGITTKETSQPIASPVASQAERRQLTVMFVDLVGSTALSGQLDPEDLSVIMRRYQNTVSGEINRLEGFVAKFMGDGVLAYFGWPRAHEDEAERAVRAALAIINEVAKLKTPEDEPLAARIGIATGQVVVGDIIGEGSAQEETVVGETPNIAARLQALAEPSNIVISDSTRHLCGEIFELESLGAQQLKGVATAVDAFKVCGERTTDSRYQAQRTGELLPLIGREFELAQIMAHWQQAKSGEGQMILLSGEAGIGKSRLLRAVVDAIADQPHYRISNQCSPYHSDSALYPVIQQLLRATGFAATDDTDTQLDKLEALLGLALAEPRQQAPLFAALLNIDGAARYGAIDLSPQQQRTQTLQVLIEQLSGLARQRPLLWIIEDAHWIDPTTLELIELALNAIRQSKLLLLITARPTFEHRLGGHPIATRIMLNHLGRESSHAIIERICGGKALPREVLDEIIRKTDGVPLFVEEFTKTVLESGQLRETETDYLLDRPIASIDIPSSLHDSLMARLDRLQPIREIAQTAACIGREFSYPLLSAVMALDDEKLQLALKQLTEAELVFQRGTPPESTYIFKHALVQDMAYTSLLKSKRQTLHARIAQVLEERFSEIVTLQPELLAFHYDRAGSGEQAVCYLERAGEMALKRSALVEAIAHLRHGIELLQTLPDGQPRQQQELRLQTLLGMPIAATKGYGSSQTAAVYERSLALSETINDTALLLPVLFGQYGYRIFVGELQKAQQLAERVLELAERQHDRASIMVGQRILGTSLFLQGKLIQAVGHLRQALSLYQPGQDDDLVLRFGQDPKIGALTFLSASLHCQGYPEQAARMSQEAITYAQQRGLVTSLAISLEWAVQTSHWRGDRDGVERHNRALAAHAEEHALEMWRAQSMLYRGWLLAQSEQSDEGIAKIRHGLKAHAATGTLFHQPVGMALLAECYLGCGQPDKGLEMIDQALAMAACNAEGYYQAELCRLKGLLLLNGSSPPLEAENWFQKSLTVARQQNAKFWELRTATSLARLWREQGKHREAHGLLEPIYGWFTEGFNTTDLRNSKALLDKLA